MLLEYQTKRMDDTFKNAIGESTIVFTDKSTSYVNIFDYVELHISEKSDEKTIKETLKWVHITVSNPKRNFVVTYHKIKKKYHQLFFYEFIY